MSDPNDQQPGNPSAEAPKTEPAEPMIPKHRFDEINKKLRDLEAQQLQRDAEGRARAEQEAAAKGEFEMLATDRGQKLAKVEQDYRSAAERLAAYEEATTAQIKQRVRTLPEELRELLIDGDALTQLQQLTRLEAAAAKLAASRTPGTAPGPRGSGMNPAVAPSAADLIAQKRASGGYDL